MRVWMKFRAHFNQNRYPLLKTTSKVRMQLNFITSPGAVAGPVLVSPSLKPMHENECENTAPGNHTDCRWWWIGEVRWRRGWEVRFHHHIHQPVEVIPKGSEAPHQARSHVCTCHTHSESSVSSSEGSPSYFHPRALIPLSSCCRSFWSSMATELEWYPNQNVWVLVHLQRTLEYHSRKGHWTALGSLALLAACIPHVSIEPLNALSRGKNPRCCCCVQTMTQLDRKCKVHPVRSWELKYLIVGGRTCQPLDPELLVARRLLTKSDCCASCDPTDKSRQIQSPKVSLKSSGTVSEHSRSMPSWFALCSQLELARNSCHHLCIPSGNCCCIRKRTRTLAHKWQWNGLPHKPQSSQTERIRNPSSIELLETGLMD